MGVGGRDDRIAIFRGWNGAREVRLRPGGSVRLGRHQDNDIVLADPSISRFHATVRWDPELDRPLLYDNGSQNGTTVDGKEIRGQAAPVRHGSTIEVTPFRLTVELQNCGETPAILTTGNDMVALFSEQGPEVRGRLGVDGASLREVLQRLEVERRSGTLHLDFDGGEAGKITLCLGKIMAAEDVGVSGLRALATLLRPRQGGFRFTRDLEPTERAMDLWFSDYLRARLAETGSTRTVKRATLFQGDEGDEDITAEREQR